MAQQFELHAELRKDVGKGASRRLRRINDLVPAIIYGAGKEPQAVTFRHNDLLKALADEGFYSRILTINAGTDSDKVILKALQRHPAKERIMHADFLRVRMDQKINVHVPLHFLNAATCVGVKTQGGVISHILSEVEVSCLPGDLPEYIEVDLLALNVGDSLHVGDLVLPPGVEIVTGHQGDDVDPTVVSVHTPRGAQETEEAEGLAGLEDGAAGTPAATGATSDDD